MSTEELIGTNQYDCPMEVKIADLGLSRECGQGELVKTVAGSPLMMAPQVLEGLEYNATADVWSLGCIFYQLLTGFDPFTAQTKEQLRDNLKKGEWNLPKTIPLSLEGLSFLNSCLQYDADKRIKISELIYTPYILDDPREEELQTL